MSRQSPYAASLAMSKWSNFTDYRTQTVRLPRDLARALLQPTVGPHAACTRYRVGQDLQALEAEGFCRGMENYARHLSGRPEGEPPATLLDYMPDDFLLLVDESHITVPQIGAMYAGVRPAGSEPY